MDQCDWSLLEPIMSIFIESPSEYVNNVIECMQNRQGNLKNTMVNESEDFGDMNITSLKYEAPLNFMFNFTSELRKNTQGKGTFTMEFLRYVPAHQKTETEALQNFADAAKG
ncbi:MAG: elongation factor EF-G [Marteilia pararefringens]